MSGELFDNLYSATFVLQDLSDRHTEFENEQNNHHHIYEKRKDEFLEKIDNELHTYARDDVADLIEEDDYDGLREKLEEIYLPVKSDPVEV